MKKKWDCLLHENFTNLLLCNKTLSDNPSLLSVIHHKSRSGLTRLCVD